MPLGYTVRPRLSLILHALLLLLLFLVAIARLSSSRFLSADELGHKVTIVIAFIVGAWLWHKAGLRQSWAISATEVELRVGYLIFEKSRSIPFDTYIAIFTVSLPSGLLRKRGSAPSQAANRTGNSNACSLAHSARTQLSSPAAARVAQMMF